MHTENRGSFAALLNFQLKISAAVETEILLCKMSDTVYDIGGCRWNKLKCVLLRSGGFFDELIFSCNRFR